MTEPTELKWSHKDEWHCRGKDFLIVVKHHAVDVPEEFRGIDGPHRWCVYAYIYPKHQMFNRFNGDAMFQDAACDLPLHCGPSYLQWHRDKDSKPLSVQVGADYNHLHDEHFTHYADAESAHRVFADAQQLHEYLTRANQGVTP